MDTTTKEYVREQRELEHQVEALVEALMDNVNRGEETGSFDECAGKIFSWIAGPESHPGRKPQLYVLIRNKLTEEAWNDHLELVDRTS